MSQSQNQNQLDQSQVTSTNSGSFDEAVDMSQPPSEATHEQIAHEVDLIKRQVTILHIGSILKCCGRAADRTKCFASDFYRLAIAGRS